MAPFPTPKCQKCGREVDMMSTSLDIHSRQWTITVTCHGKKQVMQFDAADHESQIVQAITFKDGDG